MDIQEYNAMIGGHQDLGRETDIQASNVEFGGSASIDMGFEDIQESNAEHGAATLPKESSVRQREHTDVWVGMKSGGQEHCGA